MFRSLLTSSQRTVSRAAFSMPKSGKLTPMAINMNKTIRFYSSASSLSSEEITRRIAEANQHLIKASSVEISTETNLNKDLGLDSLDATEFLVNVENEFDLQFSDEDSEKVKTIGQIVELVSSNPQAS